MPQKKHLVKRGLHANTNLGYTDFIMREHAKKVALWGGLAAVVVGILVAIYLCYGFLTGARMLPRLWIGNIAVGGMTRADATAAVGKAIKPVADHGVDVIVDQKTLTIAPEDMTLSYDIAGTVNRAASYGKLPFKSIPQLIKNGRTIVSFVYNYGSEQLDQSITDIADATDIPKKDLRLEFKGGVVSLAQDISSGLALDRASTRAAILDHLNHADTSAITALRTHDEPIITQDSANRAKEEAERIIKNPITLSYKDRTWEVTAAALGKLLESKAKETTLSVSINEEAVAKYVTTVAADINAKTTAPKLVVVDGKVTDFHMPKPGTALEEKTTIDALLKILNDRRTDSEAGKTLTLSVNESAQPELPNNFLDLGIKELIGKATTTMTGSPTNRRLNIKNGVKFLTGILIEPGMEFSTIKTLGAIDNTTGYLPELVIKGDRTTPEFGGGLCQVATTLFRAILNAGLPITARSPHSYRVSYYEKDGDGKTIGPGLDATIYDPAPDLRFINDTAGNILVMGSVVGDRITFEFYGTSDGRTSAIDGPHTLTTSPSGDPIYIKTTEVPEGTTKQVEKPHPGGSAIATYTVMRDGAEIYKKVFKSVYRPWPARYLVGVSQATLDAEKNAQQTAQPSENMPVAPPAPTEAPPAVIPAT